MSKERLDNSVLNNAISTYKTVVEVAGDIADEEHSSVLDKVTLVFLEELKQYRDLEEQGLLLRLPCKAGDTFWELNENTEPPYAYPRIAHRLQHCVYALERLGKTTFLTQSEVEEKLRELEGK